METPEPGGGSGKTAADSPSELPSASGREQTVEMAPANSSPVAPTGESKGAQNQRLARELAKRGVPPDEIQRLLSLDSPPASAADAARVAAEPVVQATLPPREPPVLHPTIALPDFADASPAQQAEADKLLLSANIARRRGNYREAESLCQQAVELAPRDAAALELYGDVMQAVGRVDDALLCYGRAEEAEPTRRTAARKYAELLLLQDRGIDLLRDEHLRRNPTLAVLFSACAPGIGQIYNGQPVKGLAIALSLLVCVVILGWTPWGFPHRISGLPASLAFFLILAGAIYIYAVIDANLGAREAPKAKSGWEV